jgi:8-amino-7-oxononanoate synthase
LKQIPKAIIELLQNRKESNAFRELTDSANLIDFYSNDYLGLAQWESKLHGAHGSTGSRLVSGNTNRTVQIEQELADFFEMESALLFNSGYDANLGLFSSLPQKGDTVLYDQLIHASIRDGIRLGRATSFAFLHNDLAELKRRLESAEGTIYVVVESIYSMDGDEADLRAFASLCEEFGAFLIVDEAHSGGIIGDQGRGLTSQGNLNERIFAKIITFGKAYGSHGAVILGSSVLRDFLINFARSFLYTTAISPQAQERILAVVQKAAKADGARIDLEKNILLFKDLMKLSTFELIPSQSPIQSIVIPGNSAVKQKAKIIQETGYAVKAILYPTVPKGKERLRICLHSYNSEKEIKNLIKAFHE